MTAQPDQLRGSERDRLARDQRRNRGSRPREFIAGVGSALVAGPHPGPFGRIGASSTPVAGTRYRKWKALSEWPWSWF
jgi:hypothetical protein